ncbi:MAG TPA: PIG-L deacetylase family protein [Vicinamibacterales bacterium]|jgi:LmbE family N-acetylglucosaminyl deacetylase
MVQTLLLSFAHPDDETFLTGGLAARCAGAGIKVVLATATLGESGKPGDPPICRPDELPAVRERELRDAVRLLGISELHLLGHRDRELAAAPPERIREQLVGLLRRARPTVVVTFDPNGANLHPDHIAISRFTSDAIAAAADARWFPGLGAAHLVRRLLWIPGRRPWELVRREDLSEQPGVDFVVDVGEWRDQKAAALRAHATQHRSAERNFFSQPDADRLLSTELFRQAWGPPLPHRPLTDIFAGIAGVIDR